MISFHLFIAKLVGEVFKGFIIRQTVIYVCHNDG